MPASLRRFAACHRLLDLTRFPVYRFPSPLVVRFQHKHYLPLTVFFGLVAPTLLGHLWGDAMGGYVWGGLVARLFIWHTTFCINSLAHWTGMQPYTDEISARGNYFLALLTSGEANHNFHHRFA